MSITLTLLDVLRTDPHGQCEDAGTGWGRLVRCLGQSYRRPNLALVIGVGDILLSNGYEDARCWLDAIPDTRSRIWMALPATLRVLPYVDEVRTHMAAMYIVRWIGGDDLDLDAALWWAAAGAHAMRELERRGQVDRPAAAAAEAMRALTCGAAARAAAKAIEAASTVDAGDLERRLQTLDWCRLSPSLHKDVILSYKDGESDNGN